MSHVLKFFGPRVSAMGIRIGQGAVRLYVGDDVAAIETAMKLCADRSEGVPYARLLNPKGEQIWESGPWDA